MHRPLRRANRRKVAEPQPDQQRTDRSTAALAIWQSKIPANGTAVEGYLDARGRTFPLPVASVSSRPEAPSGGIWPCMVALETRAADDMPLAIHRAFLAPDGSGKAPVDPAKMMLGPCRCSAVRLCQPADVLMIGQGIETCLAGMKGTGRPAWAALSTSGLRALDLLDAEWDVIVLADGGDAAPRDCVVRWMREGRRVRIAPRPRGLDFNDVLLGRVPRIEAAK